MTTRNIPIVLVSDFGHTDPFAGIVKGVILNICPNAQLVDLTHGIRPQDIFQGAFVLYRSFGFFPKGSIFCAVVDPGVGSQRAPIAIKTRNYYFVGPDNGLLWPAASADTIETCVCLDRPEFCLEQISTTFHGRDIFAPIAAWIRMGTPLHLLGRTMACPNEFKFPVPKLESQGMILTVLGRDRFGNLTLNLKSQEFESGFSALFSLEFKGVKITRVFETYEQAPKDIFFVLAGSAGFMEVALKNSSAARMLKADVLDRFLLKSRREPE
ncbi:MAG: SAM-dependent chlorinase/fluorinase [Desulfobacter sp.]|nr:SAM-dependent chlorinase/fluorinase [Desulfobacter sp.]WDP85866.1 MAG: SAM-dependent chlorinase/fluorinase [Desulfobacter sp.]